MPLPPCGSAPDAGALMMAMAGRNPEETIMNIDELFNDVPAFANLRDTNRPVWEWLKIQEKDKFRFSLRSNLAQYGSLTDGQINAVVRIIEGSKADGSVGNAFANLFNVFETAKSNGLKRPMIRTGAIKVYPAGESSRNAGCLYVKDRNGEYLGKVTPAGDFYRGKGIPDEMIDPVFHLAEDPLATAVKYARDTGHCACCGRELTDEKSVADGIGPDCKKNFGL